MIRWAALALGLALLTACGARPTGHGAPPYQEPTSVKPTPLTTHYPSLRLRFTLPAMAGDDEQAVRAYIRFSVAAFHTWTSGRQAPALSRVATAPMQRLVRKLTPVEMKYGALQEPTLVEIRQVSTQGVVSTLKTCVRHAGDPKPTATLLVQDKGGQWRVSASSPLHHHLKDCG